MIVQFDLSEIFLNILVTNFTYMYSSLRRVKFGPQHRESKLGSERHIELTRKPFWLIHIYI